MLVQLKAPGIRPHVGGIHGHIDGQIADHAHALFLGIGPQRLPLPEEEVLHISEELHITGKLPPVALHRPVPAQADVLILPLRPGPHTEMALQGHEQSVVRQPVRVFLRKGFHLVSVPLPAPVLGRLQQLEAVFIDFPVIHPGRVIPPVQRQFRLFQEAILTEKIQVHKIGISRIGGKALVGRVPIAGGPHRQQLPPGLAGRRQKVHKIVGRLSQRADAVRRGQGGDGQ